MLPRGTFKGVFGPRPSNHLHGRLPILTPPHVHSCPGGSQERPRITSVCLLPVSLALPNPPLLLPLQTISNAQFFFALVFSLFPSLQASVPPSYHRLSSKEPPQTYWEPHLLQGIRSPRLRPQPLCATICLDPSPWLLRLCSFCP